jgi:hypothetical protein
MAPTTSRRLLSKPFSRGNQVVAAKGSAIFHPRSAGSSPSRPHRFLRVGLRAALNSPSKRASMPCTFVLKVAAVSMPAPHSRPIEVAIAVRPYAPPALRRGLRASATTVGISECQYLNAGSAAGRKVERGCLAETSRLWSDDNERRAEILCYKGSETAATLGHGLRATVIAVRLWLAISSIVSPDFSSTGSRNRYRTCIQPFALASARGRLS